MTPTTDTSSMPPRSRDGAPADDRVRVGGPRTVVSPAEADRAGTSGAASPVAPAAPNGVAPPATPPAPPGRRPRGPSLIARVPRRLLYAVLAVLVIGAGSIVAYRWWQDGLRYVRTDNAQIGGYLVQVGALSPGRVTSVLYDIGDRVNIDDVIAQVVVPTTLSQTAPGTPRQQYLGRNDTVVDVRSTATGVVVARGANPGDTVVAGQAILTLVDPNQMWVTANLLETDVARVRPGQPVMVHVDNLDVDLPGKVAGISQASAQSFSPLPQMNISGNYTKVAQLQPVKIWLDRPDPRLALGTSAEVRIRVVD